MNDLELLEGQIPVDVYRNIRSICGKSERTIEAAEIGLKNSLYSIMAKIDGKIIGMARVIGDGGCACQLTDLCVLPAYQGRGIGRLLFSKLMDYVHNHLPKSCYVTFMADGTTHTLYAEYGCKLVYPNSRGMYFRNV